MTDQAPAQVWWTAAELAQSGLPDLPDTVRGINALAQRSGWAAHPTHARRRAGRGGGWEYHTALLPARAQAKLAARAAAAEAVEPPTREAAWADWDRMTEAARGRARARVEALERVELLIAGGTTVAEAIAAVAQASRVSARTLWSWRGAAREVRADDRLAYLAPRHQVAARPTKVEWTGDAFEALYGAYLRQSCPNFTDAYRAAMQICTDQGWTMPPERTARRHFEARVPRAVIVLEREGPDALKRLYPAQVRSKAHLHALECVNADGHEWDVFVRWPDGSIHTPSMCVFQDIYSGMILSWRVDQTPHRGLVLRALGDMVEDYGIPEQCSFDNGRDFASKWLTGGTKTRFRFKVRDDEPAGVLPLLGIQVHWTTPYSGQSKPIERAFRDFAQGIAKHPAFEGAYRGNSVVNKPSNYGNRAVPLDEFLDIVGRGIVEHNTRAGRRSETAAGRSLAETFRASYEAAPIRRATAAQARMWLLVAEDRRGNTETGAIELMGSQYWAPFCTGATAGKRVIVRFDPEDLHAGVHVEDIQGRYLGHAPCMVPGPYDSADAARIHGRARRDYMRAIRAWDDAARKYDAADVAAMLAKTPGPEMPAPQAKVVRPVFDRPSRGSAARAMAVDAEPADYAHYQAVAERARLKVYSADD